VDPDDGVAYTYSELRAFYSGKFKKKAIDAYWENSCTPVKGRRSRKKDPATDANFKGAGKVTAKAKAKVKAKAKAKESKRDAKAEFMSRLSKSRPFVRQAMRKTGRLAASGKTIGTHSGTFQADEALGCWLLRQLPEYAGAAVVRSRDPEILEKCDIVIDVGGVYDLSRLLFDHHQRGFFETVDGEVGKARSADEATGRWKTKLSASGLVYKHYGRQIIEQLAGTQKSETEALWEELYPKWFEAIDGIDNGIEVCEGVPRYKEGSDLSSRVGRLNLRWNEEPDKDDMARFEHASALCGSEFLHALGELVEAWLPARAQVAEALQKRLEVHPAGKVIRIPSGAMPWKDHLYALERELGISEPVKFVLFTDQSGMWRIQAVTVEGTLFTNRLSLPEKWQGLRNEALCAEAGIPGCCFVHATGFIGGNSTYDGVLAMAAKALETESA